MKNSARFSTKLASTTSSFAALVFFAGSAHAERIRFCEYTFSAVVETHDISANVVRGEVLLVTGESAGRHGGVQANTARRRARDRIVSCVNDWNSMSGDLSSAEINACSNSNISAVPGFVVETEGKSLRETILENFPGLCADVTSSEELLVNVTDARLLVTGDNGCPASRSYVPEQMLLGEFCQGL